MSSQAIYEVTKALRIFLRSQLVVQSASAVVTLLPPGDALPDASGVNLYLYRVIECPMARNRSWPGDRVTAPSDRPALGLELFYLLTPLGTRPDNASFQLGDDAHTMLGVAMLTLQQYPILNDVHLPGFDADSVLAPFLLASYEQIKVSLMPVGVEELSRIWATINQPYRLSVAYEVSLVELSPTTPPPVGGGIVTSTGVRVITLDAPRLVSLNPASGALAHISGGAVTANTLTIGGFGFSFPGQTPQVQVGGQPAVIATPPQPTDQALTVTLPTDLDAGPQADVRITLNGRTSMPLSFVVQPWLTRVQPIRTALDPAHLDANGHQVDLTLNLSGNGFSGNPQGVRFDGANTVTSFVTKSDTQASVTIPTGLANGIYYVRIVLPDTSASNSRSLEVLPLISSPIGLAVVTVAGNSVHQLILNGARLNGTNIRVVIDGVDYQVAPDPNNPGLGSNPTQLVYTLGRELSAGPHSVAINVDGHLSRNVALEV